MRVVSLSSFLLKSLCLLIISPSFRAAYTDFWTSDVSAGGSVSISGTNIIITGRDGTTNVAAFTFITNTVCYNQITVSYNWANSDESGAGFDYGAYIVTGTTRVPISATRTSISLTGATIVIPTTNGYIQLGVYASDSLSGAGVMTITDITGIECGTSSPSATPSWTPTIEPTSLSPTVIPSFMPSVSPTAVPSFTPTTIPSSNPSSMPSSQPTSSPSTSQPTFTSAPSPSPASSSNNAQLPAYAIGIIIAAGSAICCILSVLLFMLYNGRITAKVYSTKEVELP